MRVNHLKHGRHSRRTGAQETQSKTKKVMEKRQKNTVFSWKPFESAVGRHRDSEYGKYQLTRMVLTAALFFSSFFKKLCCIIDGWQKSWLRILLLDSYKTRYFTSHKIEFYYFLFFLRNQLRQFYNANQTDERTFSILFFFAKFSFYTNYKVYKVMTLSLETLIGYCSIENSLIFSGNYILFHLLLALKIIKSYN